MLWIGIVYLAGVATFLTLAQRAPLDHGDRFSDDDQSNGPRTTSENLNAQAPTPASLDAT